MTYSCAIFPELDGDLTDEMSAQNPWSGGGLKRVLPGHSFPPSPPSSEPSDSRVDVMVTPLAINEASQLNEEDPLHAAQINKLQHIIDKLHIPPTSTSGPVRVLEIGSGWGALAIRMAQQFPHVEIDTLTLSSAQKDLAEQRIAAVGLTDRITVHLMDYRNMPAEWEGCFARFVSVEMIEAVGREFMEDYWRVADWALQKKDAVGVVQVITIPEASGCFALFLPFLGCNGNVSQDSSSTSEKLTLFVNGSVVPCLINKMSPS
jgi:cyclopropane-fatty-acyl-phospholipid synthase